MSQAAMAVQRMADELRRNREKRSSDRRSPMSDTENVATEPKEEAVKTEKKARKRAKKAKTNGAAKRVRATGNKDDFAFMNIRTTKALKNAVVAAAKKNEQSLNAVVSEALEKFLR
jgi:predicted HicB family RNase H-like nuclease